MDQDNNINDLSNIASPELNDGLDTNPRPAHTQAEPQSSGVQNITIPENKTAENLSNERPSFKRRKIHMSDVECFSHSNSKEGALPLSNPMEISKSSRDVHQGLYPRPSRKSTLQDNKTSYSESNGSDPTSSICNTFVSNNTVMNSQTANVNSGFPIPGRGNTNTAVRSNVASKSTKSNSKAVIPGQRSLLSFVSTEQKRSTSATVTCSSQSSGSSQYDEDGSSGKSVMYSPIKRVSEGSVVYISDDSPSNSPPCSKDSQESKASISDNPVVKQLFESQRQLSKNPNAFKKKVKSAPSKFRKTTSSAWTTTNKQPLVSIPGGEMSSDDDDDDDLFSVAENVSRSDGYGLLGESSKEEANVINYFDILPEHIIENIFCQLPILDLCLNCNRVCLKWNNVISSEKFVPWKKHYHKLKKNDVESRHKVNSIMWNNGMTQHSSYLAALIRYMKNFKPVTADNMTECLMKHPKYSWAMALINERLQDCIQNEVVNPWCLMTTLVIISETVEDVQRILQVLTVPESQCTSKEILECMYCIATFLLAFKKAKAQDVWNGMHYRLFYALYLHENASLTSCGDMQSVFTGKSGQQSLYKYSKQNSAMKLTHEQKRIVSHNPRPGEIIKIIAFAGTGKTTTLVRYTQMRPHMQFLLVVYNKSVCDHAKTIFPFNVTCKTGHALAYRSTGMRYGASGQLRNLKVPKVIEALPNRKGDSLFVRAKFVLDTINSFLASDDLEIMSSHVPTEIYNDKTERLVPLEEHKKQWYIKDANYLWNRMIDLRDKKIPMSFDGYLKLYHLSKPKLDDYDMLLIDEAQDLTPAITDILLSQQQAKVLVGDPHQQIYSFRGAVNAMQQISADTTFYLTQSFRFGPQIAQVAACCLETLKDEKQKTLVGNGKASTVQGEQVGQLAIITRTNFTLFNEAVKKCCYDNTDQKVAFVGGTESFGFDTLQDIYTLLMPAEEREKEKRVIRDEFIKKFQSLATLEQYATKVNDVELLGKIRIVRTYHHNLPACISKILSKTSRDQRTADIVLSTAHKAKGLEFSTVRITDDYNVGTVLLQNFFIQMGGFMNPIPQSHREQNKDEGNLLYVAVTRAKHALQMTPTLKSILSGSGVKFEYPVLSDKLKQDGVKFVCRQTDAEFTPCALTLQRQETKQGDGTVHPGGLYSPEILTTNDSSFKELLGSIEDEKDNSE